ncbi:TetR/AcrR family transcriptional regulator [Brevibacillus reuszeri]|uniref:TetR/AcrR family transcriptional regulator n=1 Tax=Brevibacillus reuszeri TaxID=54915 RepID=UPI00289DDCF5|nr:TetR/AcrR family transcriptional regulator [Brevibacillus reuszeri]
MNPINEQASARKQRSLKTRAKLLAAASDVFIEYGFQKTTISQIIKKAETGYGTAYLHFTGKDDILIQLMDEVMKQFYAIAQMTFTPRSKEEASAMIEKQAGLFLEMANQERAMMQVIEEGIRLSEEVNQKWKEIREQFILHISQDIIYSQQNGLARKDVDHTLIARGWFFANEMYLWDIVRNEYNHPVDEIARNLTAMYTGGLYVE